MIATDFDREGELIGLEALEEIVEANPGLATSEGVHEDGTPVKRARYSALTKDEIERAFNNLDELSMPLAKAGAARQDIDLIWGATLTRAVSRATRRFGANFLSVGRVQSPTLGLIVERELERRAHVPKPFWEIVATFAHADGSFEAHHATDKFWKEEEAKAAIEGTKSPGTVTEIKARKQTRKPPTPLNTTAFTTDASNRLGITPGPRHAPGRGPLHGRLHLLPANRQHGLPSFYRHEAADQRAGQDRGLQGRGAAARAGLARADPRQEGDHRPPADLPTAAVNPKRLEARSEAHRKVYELIARRFLATFSEPMITESTRADIKAGSEDYFVRGSVVIEPGFAGIYTYARSADTEIPKLEEGQTIDLEGDPELIAKETQPPDRGSRRAS